MEAINPNENIDIVVNDTNNNENDTDNRIRSASVGDQPRPQKLFTSRAQSAAEAALNVRCACQFYETTLLLPDHINPFGSASDLLFTSRPGSRNAGVSGSGAASELGSRPASPQSAFYGNADSDEQKLLQRQLLQQQQHTEQQMVSCTMHANQQPPPSVFATLEQELQNAANVGAMIVQKDARQSILLQRRASSTSRPTSRNQEHGSHGNVLMQQSTSVAALCAQTMPDVAMASAGSSGAIAMPHAQRSSSSSSILRRRISQQQQQQQQSTSFDMATNQETLLAHSFVPLRGSAPLGGSTHQLGSMGGPMRGPYPGEAYPIDYTLQAKLDSIDAPENEPADDGRLENTLVRGRSVRYAIGDGEEGDTRGRSRKEKYQKQSSEKQAERKARQQEQREEDERRQKERDRKNDDRPPGGGGGGGGAGSAAAMVQSLQGTHQREDEPEKRSELPPKDPTPTKSAEQRETSQHVQQPTQQPAATEPPKASPEPQPVEPQPVEAQPPKTPAKIVDNQQISITANTLVASLFHSTFESPPVELSTQTVEPDELHYASAKLTNDDPYYIRPAHEKTPAQSPTRNATPMRQRDVSQSSVLRKRYSTEAAPTSSVNGSQQQLAMASAQRDPSQSSLLRKRYSINSSSVLLPQQPRSQSQTSATRQPLADDAASDMDEQRSQRSASVLMRQRDPSQSSILRHRMATAADDGVSMMSRTLAGSQQSFASTGTAGGLMRQRDLSSSKLLQKRSMTHSVERAAKVASVEAKEEEEAIEMELETGDRFEERR